MGILFYENILYVVYLMLGLSYFPIVIFWYNLSGISYTAYFSMGR